jgi:enamine deaminase RidA (YjgF/YER057c/UK114 family)
MLRETIVPPSNQAMYDHHHFAPATKVGGLIWVSGQVGTDADGRPGVGVAAQTRLAIENLRAVLEAAGAELSDVVELITFHTDLRGDIAAFVQVKDEFFAAPYPAWSAVGVAQLIRPELLVEIRAVAVAGSGRT